MNGVQFYLYRDIPTAHGHVIHIDTEWALTSISQLQFWRGMTPEVFGGSDVRGVLSVDVSDWSGAGIGWTPRRAVLARRGRPRDVETAQAVDQCRQGTAARRRPALVVPRPGHRHRPDTPGFLQNAEPLLVNLIDTWALRPEATTAIPNLFLASDYVRTHTDLATMEGANEAARRAVNGLLDAVKFDGPRCDVWPLHEARGPRTMAAARRRAIEAGLPWDDSLMQVAAHAMRGASPLLEQVRPLLEQVAPFVNAVAGALDLTDGIIADGNEVGAVAPTLARGAAYLPTPRYVCGRHCRRDGRYRRLRGTGGFP